MILCCGEALIDMLPRETAAGETAFAPYAGGAVFNTAIALGRLGSRTGFFSGLSSDLFGDILREALTASQVDAGPAHVSDRPTTLAFVKLTDGQAQYSFYDENTAGRMLTAADLPQDMAGVDALFFGGISLMVEPCAAAYEALAAREAAQRVIMLDPNIRPSFIADRAAYGERLDRMIARADIVKLSDEDLHWIHGPGDTDALAEALLTRGPSVVLITRGGEGATGYTARGRVSVASHRVEVADTVGAGDTFNAGVLHSLQAEGLLTKDALAGLDPEALRPALEMGSAAAAITVSRAGANPPWASELA